MLSNLRHQWQQLLTAVKSKVSFIWIKAEFTQEMQLLPHLNMLTSLLFISYCVLNVYVKRDVCPNLQNS